MTTRTITAIYDSESEAQAARQQLLSHGLDDGDVRIVSQQLSSRRVGTDPGDDKGLWESIKDLFVGDDDRPAYSEGLRRGGCLLTARVTDERTDEAIGVLEATNAIDLDQRTEQWRAEGWSDEISDDSDAYRMEQDTATSARLAGATGDERSIPVAEERLRVGKREVDRGGVRVRSYVVEEPVREDVSLREERVEIERRPAQGAAGADVFREQTIEATERGEEAVVAKDAVVTGEVVVRKTAEERTETVDDTVRHTEVEVDDTRTKPRGPSTRNKRST
ncbi:YsnF/AvaK domain-containing protein [Steroidobacter agaridevorans]|uniref:YsnF/AvaK domain-containing protein n=1 Tax=Steroidobacter agaridevorans TaxID=2695856 RepID=UPI0013795917|nr:YsnF/AvaK domain-containing protein [Steroidobacter agaridevorans]